MKNLKWRLSKLPTPDEVRELVKDKIITQDEAREILFSQETEEDRDNDSLKAEIKFLRELVEKLSNRSQIIETIRYVEKPYTHWGWYQPYVYYCNAGTSGTIGGNIMNTLGTLTGGSQAYLTATNSTTGLDYQYDSNTGSFSSIQTF